MTLFPFAEYWWLYSLFIIFVLSMLALDLGLLHRKAREVTFKEAAIWSIVWVALALAFAVVFYIYSQVQFGPEVARQNALEFLTGYVIEYSLSITSFSSYLSFDTSGYPQNTNIESFFTESSERWSFARFSSLPDRP